MNLRGYSDDFENDEYLAEDQVSRKRSTPFKVAALLVAAVLGVTYAGNITLGSSSTEFGQGILSTVACSGSAQLSLTPTVAFANTSGAGDYKISGFTVANIPAGCSGKDFTINAFNQNTNTALSLFNTDSTTVVVGQRSSGFGAAYGLSGLSVATISSSSFSVTFNSSIAQAVSTYRFTIQSGPGLISLVWAGNLGDTGPGGGKVFYYSSVGFNCGAAFSTTGSPDGGLCHYLEAAPTTWSGGASDPTLVWADSAYLSTSVPVTNANNTGIGGGFKNSEAITAQGNGSNTGAGASRLYRGGGLSDWYLPSIAELESLISYSTSSPYSTGSPGLGMKLTGGTMGFYATSNNYFSANYMHYFYAQLVTQSSNGGAYPKSSTYNTRPIRAF